MIHSLSNTLREVDLAVRQPNLLLVALWERADNDWR
jgi:hypothetical protein